MRKKIKKVIFLWEIFYFLDYFAVLSMTKMEKMGKTPNARAVVFEAAPEIEHHRRCRPRERRLKAGKMLRWSILSESPSSCAAKACGAWDGERLAKCETEEPNLLRPEKKKT
jgi:hypothetical protein